MKQQQDTPQRSFGVWRIIQRDFSLLRAAAAEWSHDKVTTLSAALSYYTVFSLGPVLLLVLSVASLVLNRGQVQHALLDQLQSVFGADAAHLIGSVLQHTERQRSGVVGTVIGMMTLLFGALGVFGQLKDSLNMIWGVKHVPGGGIVKLLRDRVLSFGMVVVIAFLLVTSLAFSAGTAALSGYISTSLPVGPWFVEAGNFVLSLGLMTVLFALVYKVLPDVAIPWRAALTGAAFTALLFSIGKTLLGLYLGRSAPGSTFGAAGSLVAVLVWVYYASQMVFLGAEVVKVSMAQSGAPLRLSPSLGTRASTTAAQHPASIQRYIPGLAVMVVSVAGALAAGRWLPRKPSR